MIRSPGLKVWGESPSGWLFIPWCSLFVFSCPSLGFTSDDVNSDLICHTFSVNPSAEFQVGPWVCCPLSSFSPLIPAHTGSQSWKADSEREFPVWDIHRGIPLPLISTHVAGRGGEEGLGECGEEGLPCRAHSRPRHQWKLWSREALQNCSQLGQRARLLAHGLDSPSMTREGGVITEGHFL